MPSSLRFIPPCDGCGSSVMMWIQFKSDISKTDSLVVPIHGVDFVLGVDWYVYWYMEDNLKERSLESLVTDRRSARIRPTMLNRRSQVVSQSRMYQWTHGTQVIEYIDVRTGSVCWSPNRCRGNELKTWLMPISFLKNIVQWSWVLWWMIKNFKNATTFTQLAGRCEEPWCLVVWGVCGLTVCNQLEPLEPHMIPSVMIH
jgi:hypothetical protein